ncbi:hypothetical protein ACFQ0X_37585 [Streptomyces rectiviolaceus]|uniref:hypothetical protein n=1 Tax=Streptomyces rectiviolaceus TaxID=332591 RepID=UPI00362FDA62
MRSKSSGAGLGRGAVRCRLAHRPESPVVAAALLALGAVSEVLLRADGDVPLPLALSLALGTTVPVAVLAGGDPVTRQPFAPTRSPRGLSAAAAVVVGAAGMLSSRRSMC